MRRASLAAAVACLSLVCAGPAAAQQDLFDDFRDDGQVDPCAYPPGQSIPPDIEQYAPGLSDQLRNRSGCGGGSAAAPAAPGGTPGATTPGTTTPQAAAAERRERKRRKAAIVTPPGPKPPSKPPLADVAAPATPVATAKADFPLWLAILLGIFALAGAAALVATRVFGVSADPITRPLRAAFIEAGGRMADAVRR